MMRRHDKPTPEGERAVEMAGLWKAWKAKSAFHSFHEPLGNLAEGRRDFHIPTAPATKADGKVENQKQVFHFPTAPSPPFLKTKKRPRALRAGLRVKM